MVLSVFNLYIIFKKKIDINKKLYSLCINTNDDYYEI